MNNAENNTGMAETTEVTTVDDVSAVSLNSIIANKYTQLLFALLFALLVLGTVGFAPMEVLHNAAHDVRHVHAFPCH